MSITVRPAAERGHADHGWLDAWHTFSFAEYRDADFMGFGPLRVLNQDRIAPGQGFDTHAHHDMEIVTWVLEGALRHEDSMGNGSVIGAGEVQVMSAGTGVEHSERNASDGEPVELLQMWVFPRSRGTTPRYGQKAFPVEDRENRFQILASPDGEMGSLVIDQDARLLATRLSPKREARHRTAGRPAWVHVARGRVRLAYGEGSQELGPGDGAAVHDEWAIAVHGIASESGPAEVVLWDLPEDWEREDGRP